jgi:hypothetical protein
MLPIFDITHASSSYHNLLALQQLNLLHGTEMYDQNSDKIKL